MPLAELDAVALAAEHTVTALKDGEIEAKDLPKSLKFLTDAASTNVSTANLLRGRPTQIVETRNAEELVRKLSAAGIVDATAVEVEEPKALAA